MASAPVILGAGSSERWAGATRSFCAPGCAKCCAGPRQISNVWCTSIAAGRKSGIESGAARLTIGGLDKVVVTHEDVSAVHAAQRTVDALSRRLLTLQAEERERIAVELHDLTAQQLTAAGLFLHSLRSRHTIDAELQRSVEQIEQTLGEARKEIRTLSYLLNPPYLDRDGLWTTLMRFVDGFARRTRLAANAQIPHKVDGFVPEVQLALLRIVQEALSNVHRHASASHVTVRIKIRRTMVLFGIFDNGQGIRSAVAGVGATARATPRPRRPRHARAHASSGRRIDDPRRHSRHDGLRQDPAGAVPAGRSRRRAR